MVIKATLFWEALFSVGLFEYMPVVTQRVVANAKPSSSNAAECSAGSSRPTQATDSVDSQSTQQHARDHDRGDQWQFASPRSRTARRSRLITMITTIIIPSHDHLS
eukprot:scpid26135/ scgid3597/ 